MTTTGPTAPPGKSSRARKREGLVALVLLVGVALGLLSLVLTPIPEEDRPDLFRHLTSISPYSLLEVHLILTTAEIVLLLALLGVYIKVFYETKASFALGLNVMLGALLLHTVFSYPLLEGLEGPVPVGPGIFLPFSDIFTIGAYVVFLYLSLE